MIPIDEIQQSDLIFQAKQTKKFYSNFRASHQNDDLLVFINIS